MSAERSPLRYAIEDRGHLTPCWVWQGHIAAKGYAIGSKAGRTYRAHRLAYELTVGPIPEGLQIDHLCRVRSCVNPAHLEPVTARENQLRGQSFAAVNAAKTHCNRGHEYTPENTVMDGRARRGRACRACRKVASRGRKRRIRALRLLDEPTP